MPIIRIDRCRCKDLSFAELLDMARVLGPDLDLIALSTGASIECGTCRPWLARALRTGEACIEVEADSLPDGAALLAHFGAGRCPGDTP